MRGTYRLASFPNLFVHVVQSVVKDSEGHVLAGRDVGPVAISPGQRKRAARVNPSRQRPSVSGLAALLTNGSSGIVLLLQHVEPRDAWLLHAVPGMMGVLCYTCKP